jgi:gliding motility-associated lipoprotein GldD
MIWEAIYHSNYYTLKKVTGIICLSLILLFGCQNESDYSPKPRGYFRIELPQHSYKNFAPQGCPYSFMIPEKSLAVRDTNPRAESCWYSILMPEINAQLYLTYKPIHNDFFQFVEDTHTLVYKHTAKASSIDEELLSFGPDVSGVVYEIGGNAASSLQFYVTDSTKHFMRGALYFNTAPNADSLKPVLNYARQDIRKMLETLQWK